MIRSAQRIRPAVLSADLQVDLVLQQACSGTAATIGTLSLLTTDAKAKIESPYLPIANGWIGTRGTSLPAAECRAGGAGARPFECLRMQRRIQSLAFRFAVSYVAGSAGMVFERLSAFAAAEPNRLAMVYKVAPRVADAVRWLRFA